MVVGPTAVGKTRFAIQLAQYLQSEIISADSRQFFKEMTIGTAVPSKEELEAAPHHFIQQLSIQENYNVYKFEQDALAKIKELFQVNDTVIVVGGSGLYLNALAYGIDELPDPSPETRKKLDEIFINQGTEGLLTLLEKLDPHFLNQVDKNNPKRLKRALEVCLTTGKPYSKLRLGMRKERDFKIIWIGLQQERSKLYERINKRVDLMIQTGLLDEIKVLYPMKHLNALNTVGYKEFFLWVDGQKSYDWAVEKMKTNTRRFAKRQLTWFNKNKDIEWLDIDEQDFTKNWIHNNL